MRYFDNPISHSSLVTHPLFSFVMLLVAVFVNRASGTIHKAKFYDNFIIFRFVSCMVFNIMITFCSLFILFMRAL